MLAHVICSDWSVGQVVFLDIENIHTMRASLRALEEAIAAGE